MGTQATRYAGTKAANVARWQRGGRASGSRPASRDRDEDGLDPRRDEGRGDEDRPARLVHRHRVPAAGVRRALPGAARQAAHLGAGDAVGEGRARCSRRSTTASRSTSCSSDIEQEAFAAASIGQVHRATLHRRARGRGQDPVPGRRRGARGRPAERGHDRAPGAGDRARARREGDRRGAARARDGGARLRVRGAEPARPSRAPTATTRSSTCPT